MVEIIPKPTEAMPRWQKIFLAVSLLLVLASALSYFLLGRFQQQIAADLKKVETLLAQGQTEKERRLENEVLTAQDKIEKFAILFGKHRYTSNVFNALEAITHPKVQFNRINFELSSSKADLEGVTESFHSLGQQLLLLQGSEAITGVELTDIYIAQEGGQVGFGLSVSFNPRIFIPK